MKKLYIILFLLFMVCRINAQQKKTDTLLLALKHAHSDTARLVALEDLARHYYISYPDSAIIFGQQTYELASKHNWTKERGVSLNMIANAYATIGDYLKGMQFYIKALKIYEKIDDIYGICTENNNIGATYVQKEDYKGAVPYLRLSEKQINIYLSSQKATFKVKKLKDIIIGNLGECYLYLNRIDSAEYYLKLGDIDTRKNNINDIIGPTQRDLGEIEVLRNNKTGALKFFRDAVIYAKKIDDVENLSIAYLSIGKLYHKYKQQDSAEYYTQLAFTTALAGKYQQDVLNAGKILYTYYDEDQNIPQAYKYYKLTMAARDSIFGQDKVKQLLSLDFDEKQRQQDIIAARVQYQNEIRTYILIAGLCVLLLLVFIFWRNSRQRKKANLLLYQQKEEIEDTLNKLQFTQDQLIQSEKMASLGELTAGIAHEIQNPLNFVNNFAEVNIELIDEMELELNNGDKNEAISIAADIRQNLEKIQHHGKRADGIVKGMLQHSRASSNVKEPTDVNKLADEYLRLAYHGLRAKDKSFNADLITHFDPKLPLVNMVPQDIGRVLLNFYTNAFYAVQQKQKNAPADYKPEITVTTLPQPAKGVTTLVAIMIRDNGTGIPDVIRDKIMQPFFTTKPTGEGTGLGLSMSYDIIKNHNGKIDISSEYGEYTEFVISIPL